jgi:hypothetical protein
VVGKQIGSVANQRLDLWRSPDTMDVTLEDGEAFSAFSFVSVERVPADFLVAAGSRIR